MEKTWRFNGSEYASKKEEFLKSLPPVSQWYTYSSEPRSYDDLIISSFASAEDHDSYICLAYACKGTPMTEEFVRDMIYVNSGMAMPGCWDERVIDFVTEQYANMPRTSQCTDIGDMIERCIVNDSCDLPEDYVNYICHKYTVGMRRRFENASNALTAASNDYKNYIKRIDEFVRLNEDNEDLIKLVKQVNNDYKKIDKVVNDILKTKTNKEMSKYSLSISESVRKMIVKAELLDRYIDHLLGDFIHNDEEYHNRYRLAVSRCKFALTTLKKRFNTLVTLVNDVEHVPFYVKDRLDWSNLSVFQPDLSSEFIKKYSKTQSYESRKDALCV